ncbi:Protein of unknown function DUF688 [Dillenia turbinata]|uniref:Uncharacterized protein n=1 Tax=Dillenia turbinata TaxID=194707 RepID=A0AAN8W0M2_9MAGN
MKNQGRRRWRKEMARMNNSSYIKQETQEMVSNSNPNGKLDFNAPLLSTRRIGGVSSLSISSSTKGGIALQDASNRIPFSWELAPGRPKDSGISDSQVEDFPPPKLPPNRWHLPNTANMDNEQDEGCEGDAEEEDENDVFSDAMDMFSLFDSLEVNESYEKKNGLDSLSLENAGSSGSHSPNFMIQRFLPAAAALAASHAMTISRNLNRRSQLPHPSEYHEECDSQSIGKMCSSSPVGCGLAKFFPWRTKHKLCGMKSLVRRSSLTSTHHLRGRRKKSPRPYKIDGYDGLYANDF